MTTPSVTPSKAKAWWALLIPMVGSLVPVIAQLAGVIPAPWGPALTGILMVFAAITGTAVHQTPYLPSNTTIVPNTDVATPPTSGWPNP
jgi:hypothetical protein